MGGQVSNAANDNDLYLGKDDGSGELVMNEMASSTASVVDVAMQIIFENSRKSQKTKLLASRLKIDGKDECVAWNRSLQQAEEYDVEELFTPVSFSFVAVGPLKSHTETAMSSG